MTKRAAKSEATHSVGFRMPLSLYRDLAAVAASRGTDVSSVLNWICAEARPALLKEKAARDAANLEASLSSLPGSIAASGNAGEALKTLREILGQMQDLYATLSKRSLDDDAKAAA